MFTDKEFVNHVEETMLLLTATLCTNLPNTQHGQNRETWKALVRRIRVPQELPLRCPGSQGPCHLPPNLMETFRAGHWSVEGCKRVISLIPGGHGHAANTTGTQARNWYERPDTPISEPSLDKNRVRIKRDHLYAPMHCGSLSQALRHVTASQSSHSSAPPGTWKFRCTSTQPLGSTATTHRGNV